MAAGVESRQDIPETGAPLSQIFLSFLKLGTTSFGGGTVAWTNREIVERRGWMTEERFLQLLTVALVMPGANPVNIAVSVGLHLRGWIGALLAALGMAAPPFFLILLFALTYHRLATYPHTQTVLAGLACVGIASMLQTGIKSALRLKEQTLSILIAVAVFAAVGVLRWPMAPVVLVAVPLSILCTYVRDRRRRHG